MDDKACNWHDEDDRRGQYGNSLSGLLITQLLNQLIALVTKIKIIITTKINIINNRMCVYIIITMITNFTQISRILVMGMTDMTRQPVKTQI